MSKEQKLEYIRKLNRGPKLSWSERLEEIRKVFPDRDWEEISKENIEMMGSVLRDMLKADLTKPGQVGPRPALDYQEGIQRLRQYSGTDWTSLPFPEAFRVLSQGRSIRHTARKTGLGRDRVFRLMRGLADPNVEVMEQVAEAFGKNPSYFKEYREAYITAHLLKYLQEQPDLTMTILAKIKQNKS